MNSDHNFDLAFVTKSAVFVSLFTTEVFSIDGTVIDHNPISINGVFKGSDLNSLFPVLHEVIKLIPKEKQVKLV